jgi:hypothetical protein
MRLTKTAGWETRVSRGVGSHYNLKEISYYKLSADVAKVGSANNLLLWSAAAQGRGSAS